MSRLKPSSFATFFRALQGRSPFPWQERLAKRVCDGDWPEVIALPTAAGKTACIDVAIFALACQASFPASKRTAPRRIFFVVDRRVIVDEAFTRARDIRDRLQTGKGADGKVHAILEQVAACLRQVSGRDNGSPLDCFQLRGGIYRDDSWARTPAQPTVIASTVDQIGSRLLYRSYGRSSSSWPVHAGLAGNDSLIIVDEAHCSVPFSQTLHAIAKFREWNDGSLRSPFQTTLMSATPPVEITDIFAADEDDRNHEVLRERFNASKPTKLVVAERAKGKNALAILAEELCNQAVKIAETGSSAVGILVNRVATAKLVHAKLKEQMEGRADIALVTGRMRPFDRDDQCGETKKWYDELSVDLSGNRRLERPVFMVATQCLEVGANLDFDAMVSECASIDALRQRFGRLNRLGRKIPANAAVVIRGDQVNPKEPDPVYGEALTKTWEWLSGQAKDGEIDFGVTAMDRRLPKKASELRVILEPLQLQARNAPVMLPAYLDCFVQTSPVPQPDPEVALFLHGPEQRRAEIQVCWRADFDPNDLNTEDPDGERWTDVLAVCPPSSAECMPVTLGTFRKWWNGQLEGGSDSNLTDIEGSVVEEEEEHSGVTAPRYAIRWRGPRESELVDIEEIRPGDTIVLPESLRGWEAFGHIPNVETGNRTVDVGDLTHMRARQQAMFRLHKSLLTNWPDCVERSELEKLIGSEEIAEVKDRLIDILIDLAEQPGCRSDLKVAVAAIRKDRGNKILAHPCGGWILVGSKGKLKSIVEKNGESEREIISNEDESSSATVRVSLKDHTKHVVSRIDDFAVACGVTEEIRDVLRTAALFHDVGKADPRFQAWLYNGSLLSSAMAPELLAKSGGMPLKPRERRLARKRAGYPEGGRHEISSVCLAESANEIRTRDEDERDLILHLIAAHHGNCRPFFMPSKRDENPIEIRFDHGGEILAISSRTNLVSMDSGVAERFWKLVRKYGWWGLAWLESILILADHRASEEEQEGEPTSKEESR